MSDYIPIGLLLLAIGVALFFVRKIGANAGGDDGSPMPLGARVTLTAYLLAFGCALVFMLVSLNSLDFPDTPVMPEPLEIPSPSPAVAQNPQAPAVAQQTPGGAIANPPATSLPTPTPAPLLFRVFPQSTIGSSPTVSLTVYGRNFTRESTVRFNARAVTVKYLSDNLITAQLEPAHLANVGSITVEVENPGNLLSNAIMVPVNRPQVPVNVFGWHPWITREVQLLLLVIFAGALGSYLHAIKSLADFIGNRTLTSSWFWWYVTRPFLGMSMALVFYAVLRGGFLAGTAADGKVVNPFGVLAIGALVGMFSDKAAQKLGEVFEVVFRSGDPRTGKLDAPVIDKLVPDTVPAGSTEPVTIKLVGDRLGKVSTLRLNSDDRKPDTVSEKEITFTLKPEDMANTGEIKITAVNPDGGVSAAATLHVSDLSIITANGDLPAAMPGVDYEETIAATGGSLPYTWSLTNAPAWLSIDQSGALKGKPAANDVKANQVTVKIVDSTGASAEATITVDVVVELGSPP